MKKVFVLLANGYEEIEALMPVDVLRRAGLDVSIVSTSEESFVTGAHNISVKSDLFLNDVDADNGDLLILPGGMPGASNLLENEKVKSLITSFYEKKKWLAAICAAPMILGEMGLLEGKKATCFPGFEKHLKGAEVVKESAITDGHIITGRGIGAAMEFSLEIVRNLLGVDVANKLGKEMVVEKYL